MVLANPTYTVYIYGSGQPYIWPAHLHCTKVGRGMLQAAHRHLQSLCDLFSPFKIYWTSLTWPFCLLVKEFSGTRYQRASPSLNQNGLTSGKICVCCRCSFSSFYYSHSPSEAFAPPGPRVEEQPPWQTPAKSWSALCVTWDWGKQGTREDPSGKHVLIHSKFKLSLPISTSKGSRSKNTLEK